MTKKDTNEIPPVDPLADEAPDGPAPFSPPAPANDKLIPFPGPRARRKQQDREAGPSEKQVYVPPVTLPPTKEPQPHEGQQKLLIAPSVLATSDDRSRPTIRRIPVEAAMLLEAQRAATTTEISPRTVGGRTARFDAGPAAPPPPDEAPNQTGVVKLPTRTQRIQTAPAAEPPTGAGSTLKTGAVSAGASPWAKDGVAQVDRANLPSALAATAPLPDDVKRAPAAAEPAPEAPRSHLRHMLLAAGLLVAAGVSIWYLTRWETPKDSPRAPIEVPVSAPPPAPPPVDTAPPATAAPPPVDTAPPAETAAPAATPPPTAGTAPVGMQPPPPSRPPPSTTRKPPRPAETASPKPTATAVAQPPPEPPPPPPPKPTTSAPPRPFD
ncbi:MAG: hypothetical protein IT372_24500 [Polyangiaceae bacterium]|nr:hypothetical protein [Polyangiaceae bacterium]